MFKVYMNLEILDPSFYSSVIEEDNYFHCTEVVEEEGMVKFNTEDYGFVCIDKESVINIEVV